MELSEVQAELDSLYKDMSSTRVRDGLKISLYENYTRRVKAASDMLREVASTPVET